VKIEATLTGIDELTKRLEAVKYETRYKGGRFALRKAAQVVRNAARSNVAEIDDPETAENIGKNITERWGSRAYKATGDLYFRVGVLGGAGGSQKTEKLAGLPGGDTRHWRHIEFGTEKAAAHPFLRRALESNVQRATDEFMRQYGKALDRAMKKG
jgi:HK97 gp10 family phage protein